MDCPTDQWGASGIRPTSCLDDYRSSKEHAHGFSKIYVMGHSYGTITCALRT